MDSGVLGGIIGSVITIIVTALVYFVTIGRKFEKLDKLEKEQDKQEKKIEEFDTELAALKEFKLTAQKFIDKQLYKDQSPLSLTPLGQSLVTNSGFMTVFEHEKDDLVRMLEDKHPTNQYDVQEKARLLMDELINYSAFEGIKTYAFKNGQDYGQILRAGAIPLRDYYLEKHPEITN